MVGGPGSWTRVILGDGGQGKGAMEQKSGLDSPVSDASSSPQALHWFKPEENWAYSMENIDTAING